MPISLTIFQWNSEFVVLWLKNVLNRSQQIFHMSRQCYCRGMGKISLWTVDQILNEHYKISLNLEFDPNVVSGMGAWCL